MRTSPFTGEAFEPKHPEHHFKSTSSFLRYIDANDPVKTFESQKREINWERLEKECPTCERLFVAKHPAQVYCIECKEKQEEEESESENAVAPNASGQNFTPREKACVVCGSIYVATAPNMKKCEECSPKGGKLVKT